MRVQFHLSDLIPAELTVENMREDTDAVVVSAHAVSPGSSCPQCGVASFRVHSCYPRVITDLPCCGRRIGHVIEIASEPKIDPRIGVIGAKV